MTAFLHGSSTPRWPRRCVLASGLAAALAAAFGEPALAATE